jgi:MFS transporter, DHA2 family, multidrug resistance protein
MRGALHLGFDEASWIGTAFNAALMFIGPFSVYLGGLLGSRRVLLTCAFLFTVISLALPYAGSLPVMLVLLVLSGLTAGTFYPPTLSFVLRNLPQRYVLVGIAMYAMDIIFTTNFATSLEAWYIDHLSWRWIFWNSAALTPIMIVLIHFGIPWQPLPHPKERQPKPHWNGFLYASLGFSALYVALDQGERLDWLHSGTIVGLLACGTFLIVATVVRRLREPNPLVNFKFLRRRNTLLLGVVLILFRFVLLATVVIIPSYLAAVKGFLPLQTGPVLLWVAIPQGLCGVMAVYLLKYVDARLMLAAGFGLVAIACVMNTNLSSARGRRELYSVPTGYGDWLCAVFLRPGRRHHSRGVQHRRSEPPNRCSDICGVLSNRTVVRRRTRRCIHAALHTAPRTIPLKHPRARGAAQPASDRPAPDRPYHPPGKPQLWAAERGWTSR